MPRFAVGFAFFLRGRSEVRTSRREHEMWSNWHISCRAVVMIRAATSMWPPERRATRVAPVIAPCPPGYHAFTVKRGLSSFGVRASASCWRAKLASGGCSLFHTRKDRTHTHHRPWQPASLFDIGRSGRTDWWARDPPLNFHGDRDPWCGDEPNAKVLSNKPRMIPLTCLGSQRVVAMHAVPGVGCWLF